MWKGSEWGLVERRGGSLPIFHDLHTQLEAYPDVLPELLVNRA